MQNVLELGKQANIAIYTVGSATADSLLFRLGYLNQEEEQMIRQEAVETGIHLLHGHTVSSSV